MGVRLVIGGENYEANSYTVQEDSTPTSANDTSGGVGTFSFNLVNVEHPYLLEGKTVSLKDTKRGTTLGTVTEVQENDQGQVTIQCLSRLGKLNVYDVQANPFSGNLRDAFRYYASLAEQNFDILVDPSIALRPVVFPGWYGELWFYLKQMAASQDCEIALVSNVILLRPLRAREAVQFRDISRGRTYGNATVSRAVEVYKYNNRVIENKLVYPPGGWTMETEVLTVGAGEVMERDIPLEASLTFIQQPVMETFVAANYDASSVYTVAGDDGLPINQQQWMQGGGYVKFSINKDTTSIKVTMRGADGLFNKDAQPISAFSLALGSDFTGNRYSTLRIIGSGVAFNKEVIRVRTCVRDSVTGTDVGITIDSPFISTADEAWATGIKAARLYAGNQMVINGQVTTINQLGDNGSANYPKYEYDQQQFEGATYGQVETMQAGKTYDDIQEAYYGVVRDDFDNQVFGNANGARVWDRHTMRWYRIRNASITPEGVSFDADDDATHADALNVYSGMTYEQVRHVFEGRTYSERDRLGFIRGDVTDVPGPGGTPYPGPTVYPATTLFPGT